MYNKLRFFIPLAVLITALSGLVYLVGQQSYRQLANDPQIQMSEDIAEQVAQGNDVKSVRDDANVDIDKSLAPFVIVYDDSGNVTASNAELDGKTPDLPAGVLNDTQDKSQTRFTWQPRSGVRIAAVVTRFSGKKSGFVLAGRNMREVEVRENLLLTHVILAWLVTMLTTVISVLICTPTQKKK